MSNRLTLCANTPGQVHKTSTTSREKGGGAGPTLYCLWRSQRPVAPLLTWGGRLPKMGAGREWVAPVWGVVQVWAWLGSVAP